MSVAFSFERECRECYGRGTVRGDGDKPCECRRCSGVGNETTDLGAEILDFVRRHLRLPETPAVPPPA